MDGRNLKEIREKNNLTQKQLAQIVGCDQSSISKYERGGIYGGRKFLEAVSEALNCHLTMNHAEYNQIKPPIFAYVVCKDDFLRDEAFLSARQLWNKYEEKKKLCIVVKKKLLLAQKEEYREKNDLMVCFGEGRTNINLKETLWNYSANNFDFVLLFVDFDSARNLKDNIITLSEKIIFGDSHIEHEKKEIPKEFITKKTYIYSLLPPKHKNENVDYLISEDFDIIEKKSVNTEKTKKKRFRISENGYAGLLAIAEKKGVSISDYVNAFVLNSGQDHPMMLIKKNRDLLLEEQDLYDKVKSDNKITRITIELSDYLQGYLQMAKSLGITYSEIISFVGELAYHHL